MLAISVHIFISYYIKCLSICSKKVSGQIGVSFQLVLPPQSSERREKLILTVSKKRKGSILLHCGDCEI